MKIGVAAAAATVLKQGATLPVSAIAGSPERVSVLLADIVETTPADFARGQGRGVQVPAGDGQSGLRSTTGGEFTSGPVSLPFEATHLGLHWVARGSSAGAVGVALRTSGDGRSWSEWQSLSIEAIADLSLGERSAETAFPIHGHGAESTGGAPGHWEVFASLASGQRGRLAQYRLDFPAGDTAAVDRMTVTAINSEDGPRETIATASVQTQKTFQGADGNSITVITRDGWGCDETKRFKSGAEIWPEMYVPSKKWVLHHTATSNNYTSGAAEVRAIYNYHAVTLGWGDIGYQALVDKSGNIYEGRHGRGEDSATREILSDDVVAGHTSGHNYGSSALAAIGTFSRVDPSSAMWTAIENVATFECGRQYVKPDASSDFLLFGDTWHDGMANISGHRDSVSTDCPGTRLYNRLGSLRTTVASRLAGAAQPALSEKNNAPKSLTAPATLEFVWTSGLTGSYCLEGWRRISTGENITYLNGYQNVESDWGGDSLAQAQTWTSVSGSGIKFSCLPAGHYTMHLQTSTGKYESNLTYLVTGTTDTSTCSEPNDPDPTPPPAQSVSVQSIEITWTKKGKNFDIVTQVKVVDQNNNPVSDATVTVEHQMPNGSKTTNSATTNSSGVSLHKVKTNSTGTYTATVTAIQKTGYTYVANSNSTKTATVA
ncbi:MAG TPA: N-acetylmuramoyl-L-alanine amidase [Chloroflexota bacterium]|nr:N-acetylmuramoyl-L-alanine amidase [Chloroflexota bacterium]